MNARPDLPQLHMPVLYAQTEAPSLEKIANAVIGDLDRFDRKFGGGWGYVASSHDNLVNGVLSGLLAPELMAVIRAYNKVQRPDLYNEDDRAENDFELEAAVKVLMANNGGMR